MARPSDQNSMRDHGSVLSESQGGARCHVREDPTAEQCGHLCRYAEHVMRDFSGTPYVKTRPWDWGDWCVGEVGEALVVFKCCC